MAENGTPTPPQKGGETLSPTPTATADKGSAPSLWPLTTQSHEKRGKPRGKKR